MITPIFKIIRFYLLLAAAGLLLVGNVSAQSMTCNFTGVNVVPVVVHVIHNGEAEGTGSNVSEATIITQLEILNQHFRKVNVPADLYPGIAADVGIEFQLARSAPDGMPHNGITRTHWSAAQPPYTKSYFDANVKPATIWNPSKYLNIWITSITGAGGYALFPANTGLGGQNNIMNNFLGNDNTDGVVISNAYVTNYLLYGSALTHEVGHYLGLLHTFQSDHLFDLFDLPTELESCSSIFGDFCDDTPKTSVNNFQDPELCGDYYSCNSTRNMTENFMDYSIPCHQIFTNNQKSRMLVSLNSPRRPDHLSYSNNEWYGLDTYEPNGSATTAANVFPVLSAAAVDSSVYSYIFYQHDYDWFMINLNHPGTLTITLDNLPKNYDLELYGAGGLSDWTDGSYNTGTTAEQITYNYTSTAQGTLYAAIYGFNHVSDKCDDYRLRIQWTPAADCIPVSASISKTDATGAGANDGSATVTVSAGASPYSYLWSNGATTASIQNLAPGTYSVTVTGNDGCTTEKSVYVGVQGAQQPHCYGTTLLTAASGTFTDGSGSAYYANNSDCSWRIDPAINNATVTLWFSAFQLTAGDTVTVYDGSSSNAPVLAKFYGSYIPPQTVSTGATMFVRFTTNSSDTLQGFTAHYSSQILSTGASIVQYQYWFDNDYANSQLFNITPIKVFNLDTDIPLDGLSEGLHTLHIRFKDDSNKWSSVLSSFFIKYSGGNESAKSIAAYEYWFDNDYANKVTQTVSHQQVFTLNTGLDVADLSDGLHTLHIRFKDDGGFWSSVLCSHFIKYGTETADDNLIVAYRYWFDMDDANMTTVLLPMPIEVYNLIANINTAALSSGTHTIHFQFKDAIGLWSGVTNDTFYNEAYPVAQFTASDTVLCHTGTVTFTNQSANANSYQWSFGDGSTSTLAHPTHTYTSQGLYTVQLIATNTTNYVHDTLTQYINVVEPDVTVSSNTSVCPGGSATLTANGAASYFWYPSTGLNTTTEQTVIATPATTTTYYVIGTDEYNCLDTANVTVSISDVVNVGVTQDTTICEGSSVSLTANGADTYTWSPVNGLNTPTGNTVIAEPATTTTYKVTGVASCGMDSTYVTVTVHPLPLASAGNDVSICEGDTTTLTATGGDFYLWSNSETTASVQVAPSTTTTYTVTVTDDNSCSSIASVVVAVNAAPTVALDSLGTVCIDAAPFALSGGTPTGGTYTGLGISNDTLNVADAGLGTHTITYTYMDENNCSAFAQNYITVDACLGVAIIPEQVGVQIFPNPTSGEVNIIISSTATTNTTIEIFNSMGQSISKESYAFKKELKTRYDMSLLAAGVYIFKILSGETVDTYRVVLGR